MAIIFGPIKTSQVIIPGDGLIQDGLLLNLDATLLSSYPGSGATWYDISGNGIDGSIAGSPPFTSGAGAYFTMSGDGTYVAVPNDTLSHGTSDFTYSTWINFTSTDSLDTIFENGSYGDTLLFRFETNEFKVFSEDAFYGSFAWTPVTDTWVNIVFKRQSNTASCYINNVQIGSTFTLDANISIAAPYLIIMRSQHTSGQDTIGKISTFSIYNRALSSLEIASNFNNLKGRYGL